MKFIPGLTPPHDISDSAWWFVFDGSRMLTQVRDDHYRIPETSDINAAGFRPVRKQYLGSLDGRACFAAESDEHKEAPGGFVFRDLRALFSLLDENLIWVAGRANQLVDWRRSHQYCGRCGQAAEDKADERARTCPQCGLINYPRLSPAIIVAVLKDDQILLARNKTFRKPFYSVLAGFVEPGETLEACVAREVKEEVGVELKNIRYFGSQPWPFPNSLMIAFMADYAGGEIEVDETEITEAQWFSSGDLPLIPARVSIARQLIDWFVENRGEAVSP
jgi:NAD+ diphosphatase